LVERLFGIQIKAVTGIPTWSPEVTTYSVRESDGVNGEGVEIGLFYLDPYAREDKRGGAWMDECLVRRRTPTGLQRPVAYLTCNFAPPLPGQPALMTHDEVLTLFHEFGHGLHHLLTRVDEASVSGIRGVAWDAVELPSQFMENWAYDRETLRGFARHWQSGEPIPDAMIEKLKLSRAFQSGLATVRQIEFALFDLRLHRDYSAALGGRVLEMLSAVRDRCRFCGHLCGIACPIAFRTFSLAVMRRAITATNGRRCCLRMLSPRLRKAIFRRRPVSASAKPCWRVAAPKRRWTCLSPSVAGGRASRRCCGTPDWCQQRVDWPRLHCAPVRSATQAGAANEKATGNPVALLISASFTSIFWPAT
jgi:hypothetical protein